MERTLDANTLYHYYQAGGINLANYIELKSDYIERLESKYPGIKEELVIRSKQYQYDR